jgi:hypothetical protein
VRQTFWFATALSCLTALGHLVAGITGGTTTHSASSESDPPLDRFEDAIRAFEQEDVEQPPTAGGTVFIGSSTFALGAPLLLEEFKHLQPIVRAFGGSTIPEINYYLDRTVLKYKPSKICFYAGTNDLGEFNHTGERVFLDFVRFARRVHARLPNTKIYFVSMSMAPSRVHFAKQYIVGNRLIRWFAAMTSYVSYVDVTTVMRNKNGEIHADWFLEDQLHMNSLGYAAWMPILHSALGD